MKIALAQFNPIIGDFDFNARRIRELAAKARDRHCDLVIFPELALCGYPPQDLLERASFLADHNAAFTHLLGDIAGIGVICGIIESHTDGFGNPLHNSAVLFEDGKVLFTVRKRLLPSYDVFDENRYFTPGRTSESFPYKGLNLGITVCEDIWNDKDSFPRPRYETNPVADLFSASARADILINIAASPFHIGKREEKEEMFAAICRRHGVPLCYVNQVGGQDSLLFDGGSMVMGAGGVTRRAALFVEDMLVVETGEISGQDSGPTVEIDEDETVFAALVMGVRDYITKCGFKSAVLGLSGGIDSALTAAIACWALGPGNVLGVALPSPYTSKASVEDAEKLACNLGCGFASIPITATFETMLATLSPQFEGRDQDVTEQNLQARIRGNLLMALSNKFGNMLLSTGNKSEMAVGYCTLYGDMNGGLAVIADLPKLLVYRLARYLNRDGEIIPERIITRPPSAELAPDQLDQDDLPPYEVLDSILIAYLEECLSIEEIVQRGHDRQTVEDVVRRITINEYKRKQAPLCLKVTSKAFGSGRRYPTAQRYREGKI